MMLARGPWKLKFLIMSGASVDGDFRHRATTENYDVDDFAAVDGIRDN